MYQHDSRENVKEFVMMSPHVMPCPIVSQITNANLKCEREPEMQTQNECDCCETFESQRNITTHQDMSHQTYFHTSRPNY